MCDLTLVVLGNYLKFSGNTPFNVVLFDGGNFIEFIKKINTKYVFFVRSSDSVSDRYFELILEKTKGDFDCCFINYKFSNLSEYDIKVPTDYKELRNNLPLYGSYLWSFIFKVEKLINLFNYKDIDNFNELVRNNFISTECINSVVYYHNSSITDTVISDDLFYVERKKDVRLTNVIYVGIGCKGTFNGYISWVRNIGKCFGDKYNITLLYDDIGELLYKEFKDKFNCVKLDSKINYLCDRLLVTYSNYFYPRNIVCLDKSYLFIHGNVNDYKNACHYYDDIYTNYVAVSKVASEKAVGYYPTNDVEYLYNPFVLDNNLLKPHLRLVSAMRSSDIKRPERLKILASVFDELEIPYTWNVFTDKNENTNINGLIYRKRTINPLPYVQDSDYFVLLSDSEALPYSVVEALALKTKVVVTPLETYDELGVKDGVNAIVIPFEYFDDSNRDKLIDVAKRIYDEKNKEFEYEFDSTLYEGYNDIFI